MPATNTTSAIRKPTGSESNASASSSGVAQTQSLTYTLVEHLRFPDYEAVDGWLRRQAVNHSDVHLKMDRVAGEAKDKGKANGAEAGKGGAGELAYVYYCAHPTGCPAGARILRCSEPPTFYHSINNDGPPSLSSSLRIHLIGPHSNSCVSAQRHQAGPIPADTYRRLMQLFEEDSTRRPGDVMMLLEEEGLGWDHTKIRYKWQNCVKAKKNKLQQRQPVHQGGGEMHDAGPSDLSGGALAALSATAAAHANAKKVDGDAAAIAGAYDDLQVNSLVDSDAVIDNDMDNLNLLLTASASAASRTRTPSLQSRNKRRRLMSEEINGSGIHGQHDYNSMAAETTNGGSPTANAGNSSPPRTRRRREEES